MKTIKSSEKLSGLLKEIRELQNQYAFSQGRSTTAERNKIATQLKKLRNERRKHKEMVELHKELISFINDNQSQVKRLEKILGNMRKIEETQGKRQYRPRLMTAEEFEKF